MDCRVHEVTRSRAQLRDLHFHFHVHWVNDAIQPSHPLLPPSSLALNLSQHQGFFQWVGSSHQVAKVLELPFLLSLLKTELMWCFRGVNFKITLLYCSEFKYQNKSSNCSLVMRMKSLIFKHKQTHLWTVPCSAFTTNHIPTKSLFPQRELF